MHSIHAFIILLFFATSCGSAHRYLQTDDPEPLEAFYVPEKIRVALVLGSGGVRGAAHVGVIEELEAAGIPIDLIVGCSAGSIVGALYADNPDACEVKNAVWKLKSESMLNISIAHCRYGLSKGNALNKVLDDHLTAETFDELKIPLVIVAADLNSGELVPMGSGDLVKAIQSSCSIPFVFVPCRHLGRSMVDGGTINPVPVKVARDLGAEIIIAVDLCELLDNTLPTNLFQIATRSAEIAFMWQNEVCSRHADFIIRPKTCGVGAFNDKKKQEIYMAGKLAAQEQIAQIKEKLDTLSTDTSSKQRLVQMDAYTPSIYHSK
jgi:Predicted esterase of the alpha-beta hydrolase superfamily